MRVLLIFCTAACPAWAGPLDRRLAAAEPCANLPGIDQTESVRFERAVISMFSETAEMTFAGRVACRTGDDKILAGNASVRIEADVSVVLDGCRTTRSEVTMSEFDGSVGTLLQTFAASLERELADEISDAAEEACRDLLDEE